MKWSIPAAALLIASGCGEAPSQIGGTMPDQVYARVVSLSPSLTELVGVLNATNLLVGRTAVDTSPPVIRNVTIVANPTPDIELIIQLQPDLVLVEENLINPAALDKLRAQDKIDVEVFDIDSMADWEEALYRLGNLLQAHSRASQVVDRVEQAKANARLPAGTEQPRVMVAMSASPPWVAGVNSYQADVVRAAGGIPVGPESDRFVATNPEEVVRWDPDIVFVSDTVDKFAGASWGATEAGKRGEILQIHPDILLRTGSELERLINAMSKEIRRVGSR